MKIIEYILEKARENGAKHFFGIPGDFAVPFFSFMDDNEIEPFIFAHEPSLGYAADAYARINGLSVAFVTYGAGGLNMVNSIAQAYAEHSPVLVISGAPELETQKKDLLVHHKVKSFKSQIKIYEEVTCISRQIQNVEDARSHIDEVIEVMIKENRPGYIEIPRDLICSTLKEDNRYKVINNAEEEKRKKEVLLELKKEIQLRLSNAQSPILLVGGEVSRRNLGNKVKALIDHLSLPYMTSMSGKSAIPETHPKFIGTYMGEMGETNTFNAFKNSDMTIILGVLETDMNTGIFSAKANKSAMVHARDGHITVGFHKYENTSVEDLLDTLINLPFVSERQIPVENQRLKKEGDYFGQITTDSVIDMINELTNENEYRFVLDVGELLFNSARLRVNDILAPNYYASMGFALPAAIASCISDEKPVVAFIGDGAFQMTGLELGVVKRYGLNPIIVVMNNSRYETMCVIDKKRKIYNTPDWDYCMLAQAAGIPSLKVTKMEDLLTGIRNATASKEPMLIEAVITNQLKSQSTIKLEQTIKSKYFQPNK